MRAAERRCHDSLSVMHDRSSEPTQTADADALSDVLVDLRLAAVGYGRCELSAPCYRAVPNTARAIPPAARCIRSTRRRSKRSAITRTRSPSAVEARRDLELARNHGERAR